MSIKARIEAIIYAAEEPVTFAQLFFLVKEEAHEECLRLRARAVEAAAEAAEAAANAPLPTFATADDEGEPEIETPVEAASEPEAETPLPVVEPEVAAESGEAADPAANADSPDPEPVESANTISDAELKTYIRTMLEELIDDFSTQEHGIEVRQIAGGYRMATKPEQHDAVRSFVRSLKPPIRLSLQALETLAVIAYKQPVTAPEISEVRGVDAGGVLGTLLDRKLITTAGRKQVVGRPILYKTTREFLLRFGLKDVNELPSMEEFEKLAAESLGPDLFTGPAGQSGAPPLPPLADVGPESEADAEAAAVQREADMESADAAAANAEEAAAEQNRAAGNTAQPPETNLIPKPEESGEPDTSAPPSTNHSGPSES